MGFAAGDTARATAVFPPEMASAHVRYDGVLVDHHNTLVLRLLRFSSLPLFFPYMYLTLLSPRLRFLLAIWADDILPSSPSLRLLNIYQFMLQYWLVENIAKPSFFFYTFFLLFFFSFLICRLNGREFLLAQKREEQVCACSPFESPTLALQHTESHLDSCAVHSSRERTTPSFFPSCHTQAVLCSWRRFLFFFPRFRLSLNRSNIKQ